MQIFIYAGLLLTGFVLGYFFQTGVLITLSAIFIILAVLWLSKAQELEALFALSFAIGGGIALLTMWVTWYFVNDQNVIQEFFKHYILR